MAVANMQKGYRVLANLSAVDGLSKQGGAWLAKVLDPYHDEPLPLIGIPDGTDAKTIKREYMASLNVNASYFGSVGLYDFQVVIMPFLFPCVLNLATRKSATDYYDIWTAAGSTNTFYPVHLVGTTSTGGALGAWPSASGAPGAAGLHRVGLEPGISLTKRLSQPYRIVACGVEIINTTEDQYKNGLVTVYRPQFEIDEKNLTLHYRNVAGTAWRHINTDIIQCPFDSIAEGVNVEGAAQWSAKEGAYMVGVLDPDEMLDYTRTIEHPILLLTNSYANQDTSVWTHSEAQVFGTVIDIIRGNTALETSVAHFTGCSLQSTFTINAKWVIESIPGLIADDDNYVASATAQLDTVALEYYRSIVRKIPAAVKLKYNPKGEYFRNIMKTLGDVATGVVQDAFGMLSDVNVSDVIGMGNL